MPERCPHCRVDPDPNVLENTELAAPYDAPAGCMTSVEIEAHLVATAKYIEGEAKKLTGKGKGRINLATAFKGFEASLKHWQLTLELVKTRERREYVGRLESINAARERRSRGASN